MPGEDALPDSTLHPAQPQGGKGRAGLFPDVVPGGAGGQPTTLGPAAIHAPWRLDYLEDLSAKEKAPKPAAAAPAADAGAGSFLREYWLHPEKDVAHHVVVRTGVGMILLNAFPYATGHLLVTLGEARPTLLDYTPAQRAALWTLTDAAAALVEMTFEPQGVNIGVNQGRAAGAGVPGHLHVHLVPRWAGDVNFTTTIAQVRIIPQALDKTAERYRAAWTRLAPAWRGLLDGTI